MTCVGFEHTIPASERAKTVHASDRKTTVTDPSGSATEILFCACYMRISTDETKLSNLPRNFHRVYQRLWDLPTAKQRARI
jgi:hypothetical protein